MEIVLELHVFVSIVRTTFRKERKSDSSECSISLKKKVFYEIVKPRSHKHKDIRSQIVLSTTKSLL